MRRRARAERREGKGRLLRKRSVVAHRDDVLPIPLRKSPFVSTPSLGSALARARAALSWTTPHGVDEEEEQIEGGLAQRAMERKESNIPHTHAFY